MAGSKAKSSNFLLDTMRVVPTQYKVSKNKNSDRLTDLLAVLFIFGVAVFARYYSRDIFISTYNDNIFHLIIGEEDPLGIGRYTGIEAGETLYLEGYADFGYYYLDYVDALLDGWNPYSGSRVDGDHLGGYVYGPLYIYSISIGKAWFDLSTYDSIVVSNVVFDSLSYVMVYMIGKKVSGNVIALIVAFVGSFSPIALFYANIRGLNAPLMNFLALVFVYFFLERKDGRAIFFLAMATMTKQFPLFLALPVGFWMMRRYGILKGIGFILLYIFDILLISVPWILKDPWAYVRRLFLPGGGKDIVSCPEGGEATNLVHGGLVEICQTYGGQAVPADSVPGFADFIFPLVNYHIIFFGFVFLFGWLALTGYDYFERDNKLYLVFFAAFYTIAHATIARGIYKYYLTMLIPFILLAFLPGNRDKSLNIRIGAMLNRMINLYMKPKYRLQKPSFGYWSGILFITLAIGGIIWVIDACISLFTTTQGYHSLWLVAFVPLALYFIKSPGPVPIETNDTISLDEHSRNLPIWLMIAAAGSLLIYKIAALYFESESDLTRNLIIMGIIIAIFTLLPYIAKITLKASSTFNFAKVDPNQLAWDILGLVIAFIVINFFTIQILVTHRFLTTTVVFFMGVVLMGMLQGDIWISAIRVPISAYKNYRPMVIAILTVLLITILIIVVIAIIVAIILMF